MADLLDKEIVALYWARDERALEETERAYGSLCRGLARRILKNSEDAEECVSDAWLAAWNRIPPAKPESLRAFLGKITRTLAISRFRSLHAQKRGAGLTLLLSELEDCLPAAGSVEQVLEQAELNRILQEWLDGLAAEDRKLFVRRYWYGVSVKALAAEAETKQNLMAQRLLRLRRKLKARLEQEGEYL